MEKKVKNVIKSYEKLSAEELEAFLDYLKPDEDEEKEKVEVKEEVKEEKKEVKEIKEEVKQDFVTNDQLKDVLAQLLQSVALKEEVKELKVDKKKAEKFGADGKPIVNEGDDRDLRLAKILADFN